MYGTTLASRVGEAEPDSYIGTAIYIHTFCDTINEKFRIWLSMNNLIWEHFQWF